jgi:hypothetical protein
MSRAILASAILVLLGAIGPALADDCNCTFSGERPCFVIISCEGEEEALCSCTSNGCATSCGPADPNELADTFSSFQITDMLLDGIGDHFGDSGWKFVTTSRSGRPLSTEREMMDWADLTFEELLQNVAEIYGVCVETSEEEKVITFKRCG